MDADTGIPLPIRFNPFKHHRNYLLDVLNYASPAVITDLLDPICNNYIDIYTGGMTPAVIANSVIALLKSEQILLRDRFSRWVSARSGYRKIRLDDHSEWIVRESEEPGRYIHLHPARTGPFTIRFKGSTLKTVYLLKTGFTGKEEELSTELINRARKQINLSPVSGIDRCKGIVKCYLTFPANRL